MSLVVSGKSLTSTCSGLTMIAGITTILWDLGQFHGTSATFRVMGLGPISFMGLGHATLMAATAVKSFLAGGS